MNEERLKRALITWGGDVSATADALGIHRNNLYKWLKRYGISREYLLTLRAQRAQRVQGGAMPDGTRNVAQRAQRPVSLATRSAHAAGAHEIRNATVTSDGVAPIFPAMPEAAIDEKELPLKPAAKLAKPMRVLPEVQDLIRDMRRQLSAALGVDLDDTDILNRILLDTKDGWFQQQMAAVKKRGGRKPPSPGAEEPER